MKTLRKICALVLVVMMIAVVGAAWADTDNVYEGTNQVPAKSMAGTRSIPLNKTIVIFNTTDSTQVREPDITYSYTIAKVDPSAAEAVQLTATVNDGTNTVKVYNGYFENSAITNPNDIVFDHTNTVAATKKGVEVEKSTSIGVDPTSFPHAGVYRYVITETPTVTRESVGMEARTTDYVDTRYLDVYIFNPDNDHITQWMGGAVIYKAASTDDSTPANTASSAITPTTDKTTGFEPGSNTPASGENDYTNDGTVDRYFTYNLTVNKAINGTLADKGHDFPFKITLRDNLTHEVLADYTSSGSTYTGGTAPTTITISSTDVSVTPAMSDGDSITINGLPKGTTVDVKEYNDTVDSYKLITSFTAGTTSTATITTATQVSTDLTKPTGETGILVNSANASAVVTTADTAITFTNTLDSISPTGYVTRFAPYALILVGGIVLLIIAKKRKPAKDEEE